MMLKIENAAGLNLPIGTGKFKTRKIKADKAKNSICIIQFMGCIHLPEYT